MTPMLRTDRNGHLSLAAPLKQPPSASYLIARTIAEIFLVPAVILIVVWVVAGSGFGVSVPVQSVEEDDAPRSEQP